MFATSAAVEFRAPGHFSFCYFLPDDWRERAAETSARIRKPVTVSWADGRPDETVTAPPAPLRPAALPHHHLPDLVTGEATSDGWHRWVGGAAQEARGELLTSFGRTWIPAGTRVDVVRGELRGLGRREAPWVHIEYPAGARERFDEALDLHQLVEAEGHTPDHQERIDAGMPADWRTDGPYAGPPRDVWGGDIGSRRGANVRVLGGVVYSRPDFSSPWIAGAPWV